MVIIHAYLKVKQDQQAKFLEAAKNVIEHSQAEEGNNSYNLYEDTQQENAFVFVEEWRDRAAIDEHEQTQHFKDFIRVLPELLAEEISVKKYEVSR
ncbi:putative quinol monooxygenase [Peribacillus sp. SCS-155]|uniref:putative quinol monooxygenase n=1 Tax=Peribacillus sedimenti TaxID=3115297 RepID=UPI003906BCF2